MDSLKNLVIIALLAAIGYWLWTSLNRNNVESDPPPGAAAAWPSVPKVDLSDATPANRPGGPLALSAGETAPQVAAPSTTVMPATPYPSSAPPLEPTTVEPLTPAATLDPPIGLGTSPMTPSSHVSTPPEAVRNLVPPPDMASGDTAPPATDPTERLLQNKFDTFMEAVQKSLDQGRLAEAHLALSSLYGNPDLPADQAARITDLLDRLAGTVIYSRHHYLEPAYHAQSGDTLDSVARRYDIPWQLLGRINGLIPPGPTSSEDPVKDQPLPPGTELKVVRGPFEAVVNLDRHELTLMVQGRYAGRFPIGVGRDQPKLDGEYTVHDKTPSPAYQGPDGVHFDPNDPQNPLGDAWIGLTDQIGIHGVGNPAAIGRDDNRGAICVGDRDLQDLYGILSVGSRVRILR